MSAASSPSSSSSLEEIGMIDAQALEAAVKAKQQRCAKRTHQQRGSDGRSLLSPSSSELPIENNSASGRSRSRRTRTAAITGRNRLTSRFDKTSTVHGKVSLKRPVPLVTFLMRIAWRVSRLLIWTHSSRASLQSETELQGAGQSPSALTNVVKGAHVMLNLLSNQENMGYQHWKILNDFIARMYVVVANNRTPQRGGDQRENDDLNEYVATLLNSLFNTDNNIRHSVFLAMCLWRFAALQQFTPLTETHAMREKTLIRSATNPHIEFTLYTKLIPKMKEEFRASSGLLTYSAPPQQNGTITLTCRDIPWTTTGTAKDLRDLIRRDLYRTRKCKWPAPLTMATALYLSFYEGQEGLDDMIELLSTLRREFINPYIVESSERNASLQQCHVCSSAPFLEAEIICRLKQIELASDLDITIIQNSLPHLRNQGRETNRRPDPLHVTDFSPPTEENDNQNELLTPIITVRSHYQALEHLVLDLIRCSQGQCGCLAFIAFGRQELSFSPSSILRAELLAEIIQEALTFCPLTVEDWAAITYLASFHERSVATVINTAVISNTIQDFLTGRRVSDYGYPPQPSICVPAFLLLLTATKGNDDIATNTMKQCLGSLVKLDCAAQFPPSNLGPHQVNLLTNRMYDVFQKDTGLFQEVYGHHITADLLLKQFGITTTSS